MCLFGIHIETRGVEDGIFLVTAFDIRPGED